MFMMLHVFHMLFMMLHVFHMLFMMLHVFHMLFMMLHVFHMLFMMLHVLHMLFGHYVLHVIICRPLPRSPVVGPAWLSDRRAIVARL